MRKTCYWQRIVFTALCGTLLLPATGCYFGPPQVEQIEMIEPNETGFVVPLEGDAAKQGKFQSEAFLRNAQVAALRVTIPTRQRKLGRTIGNREWVRTAAVVKVDRTPITREWTKDLETGTSSKDDALKVQSSEPYAPREHQ